MQHTAVHKHGHVRRPAAHVDQRHPQVELVVIERRLGRRQRLDDHVLHAEPGLLHALDHVLDRSQRPGYDVGFDLQAGTAHADGIADSLLAVDHVSAGNDVDDLAIAGHRHGPRRVDHASHVGMRDLVVGPRDRHHAAAVLTEHMGAGQTDIHGLHPLAGHPLGTLHRLRDAVHGLFHVDHGASPEAFGGGFADPDDVEAAFGQLADHAANLRGADVQGRNIFRTWQRLFLGRTGRTVCHIIRWLLQPDNTSRAGYPQPSRDG